jgi:hypothetical protein
VEDEKSGQRLHRTVYFTRADMPAANRERSARLAEGTVGRIRKPENTETDQ